MVLAKIILLLLAGGVMGCAGLPREETSQTSVEKERQEQKKDSAMPTFTYRPGS